MTDAAGPTLADILMLERGDGDDRFVGHSPPEQRPRVFGGQVVAQALVAATATVDPGHHVHSLHAYFLRGGDVARPIAYDVDRLRDGRSFTARRVTADQGDGAILVLSVSFHAPGTGGGYDPPAPEGVPDPDSDLPPAGFSRPGVLDGRDASAGDLASPHRRLWFRAGCPLPDDLHAAGVAYATDHGPFGAARRVVDLQDEGRFDAMFRASLDHAIWFHRPPRIDDWVLFEVDALAYRDDRVLTSGRVVDRKGRLVATVVQEILARAPGG